MSIEKYKTITALWAIFYFISCEHAESMRRRERERVLTTIIFNRDDGSAVRYAIVNRKVFDSDGMRLPRSRRMPRSQRVSTTEVQELLPFLSLVPALTEGEIANARISMDEDAPFPSLTIPEVSAEVQEPRQLFPSIHVFDDACKSLFPRLNFE
ncbi:MAG: hypothetical protein LBG04_01105 [Holosporaceae bacterium]|jgi:hypothetical protein|nr:hypothetical protein [Holosporaceae bacterium]